MTVLLMGFGGKAPDDSSHLIIRVFLFRFHFFFFLRNKKEKVNKSIWLFAQFVRDYYVTSYFCLTLHLAINVTPCLPNMSCGQPIVLADSSTLCSVRSRNDMHNIFCNEPISLFRFPYYLKNFLHTYSFLLLRNELIFLFPFSSMRKRFKTWCIHNKIS